MHVNVVPPHDSRNWFQRLTGSEPRTVQHVPGEAFKLKNALLGGGIGAAVAGALGGVSLLGKVALPVIGKVASVSGLVRLAGVGGALGVAAAALPAIAPKIRDNPSAKAAAIGAGIGAAAGAVLPLLPISVGAAFGAGVGLLVHHRGDRYDHYRRYPGYDAYPGYVPHGVQVDVSVPSGLVPVTPNYGAYAGTAMNPYGNLGGYALPQLGYGQGYPGMGFNPYGAMTLPMQATGVQQPGVAQPMMTPVPAAARPAAPVTSAKVPKFKGATSFTDGAGNLRQVGTGRIIRPATGSTVGVMPVATTTPAPLGAYGAVPQAMAGMAGMTTPLQPGAIPAMPNA